MADPRVHNKHHGTAPPTARYIGRGSPFGNQFVIGPDGDRATVVSRHRQSVASDPALVDRVRRELAGRDLLCFCAPRACHGDFLLVLANAPQDTLPEILIAAMNSTPAS